LFICLYVWLEKYFSRGDYKKQPASNCGPELSGIAMSYKNTNVPHVD
jgi:hypothetical protein